MRIAGDDDFLSVGRFGESKSAPISPQAVAPKSLVFSPRIQFHDTWPSGEYDRRGDIATCNRLTPLLAQQIKEELNNFKMVRFDGASGRLWLLADSADRRWKFTRPLKSIPIFSEPLHSERRFPQPSFRANLHVIYSLDGCWIYDACGTPALEFFHLIVDLLAFSC